MWALYKLFRGVSYIYLMWSKEFPETRNSKPDVQHSEIGNPMELLPSFQWHTGSFEDTSLPLLWARLKPFSKSQSVLRVTQCVSVCPSVTPYQWLIAFAYLKVSIFWPSNFLVFVCGRGARWPIYANTTTPRNATSYYWLDSNLLVWALKEKTIFWICTVAFLVILVVAVTSTAVRYFDLYNLYTCYEFALRTCLCNSHTYMYVYIYIIYVYAINLTTNPFSPVLTAGT